MNSLCLFSFLLPLLSRDSLVYSSESGLENDYYTAHFPNGKTYTYPTAKGLSKSSWNKTRAAEEILDAHNDARRELNLTSLDRSPLLEEYAREHARLCGNNSEPDPSNLLPHLEGNSLLMNIKVLVDPTMVYSYTEVGERFYSEQAKRDYEEGRVPADFNADMNSDYYEEFYAYFQIIQPDLRWLGCYGWRCDPIDNPLRIAPEVYFSIRYLHWTYLVCYYTNRTEPERVVSDLPSILGQPSPSTSPSSNTIPSLLPSLGMQLLSPSMSPLPNPSVSPLPSLNMSPLPSRSMSPLSSPSMSPLPNLSMSPLPTSSVSPLLSPSISPLLSPSLLPLPSPSRSPLPSLSMSPLLSPSLSPLLSLSMLPLPSPSRSPLPNPRMSPLPSPSMSLLSSPSVSPLLSSPLNQSTSQLPSPSISPLSPIISPLPNPTIHSPSIVPAQNPITSKLPSPSRSSLLSSPLPSSKNLTDVALVLSDGADHTNCSSVPYLLPLVITLASLLLIFCMSLVLVPCVLTRYHKRVLSQIADKNECERVRVKFDTGNSLNEHSRLAHGNKTDTNIYEAPTFINGNASLCESVYLKTYFDESSVDNGLSTVVTSHSYPITVTVSERGTNLGDQSCKIVHENVYAMQFDLEESEQQHRQFIELDNSNERSSTRS